MTRREEGWDCSEQSDGKTKCERFEVDEQGHKIATGTSFAVGANPETGCQPYFEGDLSIMDRDERRVNKIVKKKISSCKRGL